MAKKGKNVDEAEPTKGSLAEVSILDCVRDIPVLNSEDIEGEEQPVMCMFNTLRTHLLERDNSNRAVQQAHGQQVKAVSDALAGQAKMMEVMWLQQ
ncbi:hypothetical protein PIB30_022358 [Stylosanthes scabra]|uniref:Uncharacterized protein n=1 Tax=Stylosanthes scabra TaxID=79078 RepID=A0ABU6WCP0_9FABA|nr:hypothetical protein [Stylosanthes scabra]